MKNYQVGSSNQPLLYRRIAFFIELTMQVSVREKQGNPMGLLAQHLNISVRALSSIVRNKKHVTHDQIVNFANKDEVRMKEKKANIIC